ARSRPGIQFSTRLPGARRLLRRGSAGVALACPALFRWLARPGLAGERLVRTQGSVSYAVGGHREVDPCIKRSSPCLRLLAEDLFGAGADRRDRFLAKPGRIDSAVLDSLVPEVRGLVRDDQRWRPGSGASFHQVEIE